MLCLLHLLDHSPDYQTETAAGQLVRGANAICATETRTIGWGGDYGTAVSAILSLRRHRATADLTHAWGETALTVAAVGIGGPIVYSPATFPTRKSVRWLRSIMDYRDVQVVCPIDTMRRAFVERGVPIERCHLIRPGVEFARVKRRRDPALRAALGFGPDNFVMLAVGESTRAADHARSAWASVILHVLDRKHRLLLWGRGSLQNSVRRFAANLGQPDLFRDASAVLGRAVTFEELLPATDVALVTAQGPVSTLPIAVCMAAGLPIVSVVSPTVAELLEDRHNALLVSTDSPRQIARRVLDLREDDNLQWSISDMARTEAYEYFSMTRFVEQFNALYGQVASGEPVKVPQPGPGAGARFHGRV